MVRRLSIALSCLVLVVCGAPRAKAATCNPLSGRFTEHILPQASVPNDPAGRVLGNVIGSLAGSTTAFISSLSPQLNGNLHVTTNNAFVTLEGNQLFMTGDAIWTLVKNGYYQVELTLTIVGGTGKYNGASGSMTTQGIGDNVGPGSGQFLHEYHGQVCTP
jgi:hypothetical protein